MSKFMKVKFRQAVELEGVGYSPVGGPESNGVYHSVPAAAVDGWYFAALAKDGAVEDQGAGVSPEDALADVVAEEHRDAFEASGMTIEQWAGLLPVERDARAQAFADAAGRQTSIDRAIADALVVNTANTTGNPEDGSNTDGGTPAAKTVVKPAAKTAAKSKR